VNINQLFVLKTQFEVDFVDIIAPREAKVKVNSRKKSFFIDYSLNQLPQKLNNSLPKRSNGHPALTSKHPQSTNRVPAARIPAVREKDMGKHVFSPFRACFFAHVRVNYTL